VVNDSRLLIRLQEELGYVFSDPTLLLRCLTHVSYERREGMDHNETLEFLGDAVLNLAISDLMMRRFPDKNEGDLSRMRASLVNSVILAEKATGKLTAELSLKHGVSISNVFLRESEWLHDDTPFLSNVRDEVVPA